MFPILNSLKSYHVFNFLLVLNLLALSLQFRAADGNTVLKNWFFRMTTPIGVTFIDSAKGVTDLTGSFQTVQQLRRENLALRKQLDQLRFDKTRLADRFAAQASAARIGKILTNYQQEGVLAEIISKSFQVWDKTLLIRGGAGDGFEPDLPVLDADGVIGRIQQCTGHYSQVLLLNNTGFAMAGWIPEKDIRGIVYGAGEVLLRYDYVHLTAKVDRGDRVYSSGNDGIFPPGYPIGVVVAVRKTGQYFQEIRLRPAVNIDHVRFAFVLRKTSGSPR